MKLESGKMELNKKRVELQPLVEKVTEKFEVQDGDKPIEFTLDLQAKYVYADEEMLEEVFNNLIENAIKYSNESVDIRISSENEEKRTAIRVRDNGLGIGKQYLQSIFNKYERGAADRRVRSGGATGFGIGLNFVQQVVAAHEGDITATSREKEFTEFTIHLPNIYD